MSNGRERSGPPSPDIKKETEAATRSVTIVDGRIGSGALFGPSRQIMIEHGTDTYTLRVTAQNKLILTK